MSYLPSRLLVSSGRPFCLTEDSPISWITNYRGHTYELAHDGRLLHLQQTPRPPQRIGAAMSTAHLEQMRENRQRDAARAVHHELCALALRRAEQHAKEQPR